MKKIKFNIPAKNKKTTAIDFILSELERATNHHIMDLVEKFAKIGLDRKKASLKYDRHVFPTLRGYTSAIRNSIVQLEKNKKIIMIDYWSIRKI